jgi:transcriptional regulator with XRE-family HTH domain
LRREEVAQLCGVSPTWYTWIEQGRPVSASADALARIAVALQLSKAERAYLFELAAQRDPAEPDVAAGDLPPTLAATVAAIATPAYVLDRNGTRSRGTRRPPRCLPAGSTASTIAICCASRSWRRPRVR